MKKATAILFLCLGACGISPQVRAELIDAAVRAAGDRAEKEARKLLDARIAKELETLKSSGATPEQIEAARKKMSEEGAASIALLRAEIEERARTEANARLPQADPDGGGWLGKLFGILSPFLLVGLKALVKENA